MCKPVTGLRCASNSCTSLGLTFLSFDCGRPVRIWIHEGATEVYRRPGLFWIWISELCHPQKPVRKTDTCKDWHFMQVWDLEGGLNFHVPKLHFFEKATIKFRSKRCTEVLRSIIEDSWHFAWVQVFRMKLGLLLWRICGACR